MFFTTWLRSLRSCLETSSVRQARKYRRPSDRPIYRPHLELLEDRTAPATFVVTNTLDDGSTGSLRWAINQVNADTDPLSYINFNIPGSGMQTISLLSPLPDINHPVVIDGYTQPGSSPNTRAVGDNAVWEVTIDGSQAGTGFGANSWPPSGLVIASGGSGSTVCGLVIQNFDFSGVFVRANNVLVEGNYITFNSNSSDLIGNEGVLTLPSYGTTIGGTTPAARNVISGWGADVDIENNSPDPSLPGNLVEGNYIGTNSAGTASSGANGDGINVIDVDTTIGGMALAEAT